MNPEDPEAIRLQFRMELKHYTTEQVDTFMNDCDCLIVMACVFEDPSLLYTPANHKRIKAWKKALKHLKSLRELSPIIGHMDCTDLNLVEDVDKYIRCLEYALASNELFNSGGKPSSLDFRTFTLLNLLKEVFVVSFPDAAHHYHNETTLQKLGEALTGRDMLPKNTDAVLDGKVSVSTIIDVPMFTLFDGRASSGAATG